MPYQFCEQRSGVGAQRQPTLLNAIIAALLWMLALPVIVSVAILVVIVTSLLFWIAVGVIAVAAMVF